MVPSHSERAGGGCHGSVSDWSGVSACKEGGEIKINVDVLWMGKDNEGDLDAPRDGNGNINSKAPAVALEPTPSPVTTAASNPPPLMSPLASPSQRLRSLSLTPLPLPSLISLPPLLLPLVLINEFTDSSLVATSSRTCETGNVGNGATVETAQLLSSADVPDAVDSCPTTFFFANPVGHPRLAA